MCSTGTFRVHVWSSVSQRFWCACVCVHGRPWFDLDPLGCDSSFFPFFLFFFPLSEQWVVWKAFIWLPIEVFLRPNHASVKHHGYVFSGFNLRLFFLDITDSFGLGPWRGRPSVQVLLFHQFISALCPGSFQEADLQFQARLKPY